MDVYFDRICSNESHTWECSFVVFIYFLSKCYMWYYAKCLEALLQCFLKIASAQFWFLTEQRYFLGMAISWLFVFLLFCRLLVSSRVFTWNMSQCLRLILNRVCVILKGAWTFVTNIALLLKHEWTTRKYTNTHKHCNTWLDFAKYKSISKLT